MRPRQNGRHFPDDIFKCIFLNEKISISITISLKFVPKGQINDNPALVQIMAWSRPGDKPLLEPMMTNISDAIYTRPQWVPPFSLTEENNLLLWVFNKYKTAESLGTSSAMESWISGSLLSTMKIDDNYLHRLNVQITEMNGNTILCFLKYMQHVKG